MAYCITIDMYPVTCVIACALAKIGLSIKHATMRYELQKVSGYAELCYYSVL